jgi:hypothetical protein
MSKNSKAADNPPTPGANPPSGKDITSSTAAAQWLASKEGITPQELVGRGLNRMRTEGKRPIDCLHVADLEDVAKGVALSPDMQEHIAECATCKALLNLAKPSPEAEERFATAVREAESVLRTIGNVVARKRR